MDYSTTTLSWKWILFGLVTGAVGIAAVLFLFQGKQVSAPVVSNSQNQVQTQSDSSCGEFCIKTFSPNNLFELHSSGTGVERTFEIFEVKTYKKVATFSALSKYVWWGSSAFIFEEPTPVTEQSSYRPWESGFGFSIKRLNLETGEMTTLQKSDSTHDYMLEYNPDGSIVSSSQGIWIDVNTYQTDGGSDRFLHPEIHSWIMNPDTGALVGNVDNYENNGK